MLRAFPRVTRRSTGRRYIDLMNTRIVLARRPVGWVDDACFALEDCPEPDLPPEGVLLQAVYLSLDPYLRGRMNEGPSYAPGFALGAPIVSRVVARVIASRHARFQVGDCVWGFLDWAERVRVPRGEGLHKIDPALGRISHAVSVLGMPGLTAWVGAMQIGKPAPGDTVYVSGVIAYTTPADIMAWNAASDDWHTTRASVDLRPGGDFCSRMEAKDGSMGFDFEGTYTRVEPNRVIAYRMPDDREVTVDANPFVLARVLKFCGDAHARAFRE